MSVQRKRYSAEDKTRVAIEGVNVKRILAHPQNGIGGEIQEALSDRIKGLVFP
jgi:hypothetical protein